MIQNPSDTNLGKEDIEGAVQYVPMKRVDVELADTIVDLAKGRPNRVAGERDWEIIEKLIGVWMTMRPEEVKPFKHQMDVYRETTGKHGEGETAEMRSTIAIPIFLESLIKAVYPEQKTQNKEFSLKFAKRFSGFQIPDKL